MPVIALEWIEGAFSVCKVPCGFTPPMDTDFLFYARTDGEISIVCRAEKEPRDALAVQGPFCAMRACGTLDFSLVGVLAGLSAPLARAGVAILAVSTYDTDYLLVPYADREKTARALADAGFRFAAGDGAAAQGIDV